LKEEENEGEGADEAEPGHIETLRPQTSAGAF
jgi:hypothetical protein